MDSVKLKYSQVVPTVSEQLKPLVATGSLCVKVHPQPGFILVL